MQLLFKIPKYQLYLLQLENYELGRYLKLLFKKGLWPKGAQRKTLVWTSKAKALMLMAVGLHLLIIICLALNSSLWFLLGLIVLIPVYFIFFSIALLLLWPFDWLVKRVVIYRAKLKIQKLQNLKVIGVAGSYGKTTMKEVLLEVLGAKFNAAATPESVNTPVGIARWILKKFDDSLEVAIVEMGEHYSGDVEELCRLTQPDIAVVTGINEAHLERMGTMENVTATIFEIVSNLKPKGLAVLNGDDDLVIGNYKKFVWPDHRVEKFQISNFKFQKFNTEALYWECEHKDLGSIKIHLLGEYALADVDCAIKIALELGVSNEEIKQGIEKIKPVEHRLQPIKSAGNILVIDDSYNSSPAAAKEAMAVLARFKNRRKLYITPGMVEMGKAAKETHLKIGQELAEVADVVILIKNSVTPFVEEGIRSEGAGLRVEGEKPKVIWFETAGEAHQALKDILRPNDVILFQNDWGDQYV